MPLLRVSQALMFALSKTNKSLKILKVLSRECKRAPSRHRVKSVLYQLLQAFLLLNLLTGRLHDVWGV